VAEAGLVIFRVVTVAPVAVPALRPILKTVRLVQLTVTAEEASISEPE
jgi:hypothetical protein